MSVINVLILLFGLSLLIDLAGFIRLVYFLSIGYTFAMVAMCVAVAVVYAPQMSAFAWLHLAGLGAWGLRLGVFVLQRERRPSYRKELAAIQQHYGGVTRRMQVLIWVGVSFLYVIMFLPAVLNAVGVPGAVALSANAFQVAGLLALLGGLGLEALADQQKSAFKVRHPDRFCDAGLYRWVRCPNYLGELLVWTGSWLMGVPFYTTAWHWAFSLLGLVSIIGVMFNSTQRLEATQQARYGQTPEYQAYARRVPVLIPFVPLYSLEMKPRRPAQHTGD